MKTILALLSLSILLASCEDVIEINLDTIEPRLVIEGCLNDMSDHCTVNLSLTSDYFNPDAYPAVSDADISISDEYGTTSIFNETEPGVYTLENMQVMENTSYTLDIWSEDENYTAEVTIPEKVNIEYLSFDVPPLMFEFDEGYMLSCYIQDPVEYRNYYRMKAYKISDQTEARDSEYIFNDDFMNGNMMIMQWDLDPFMPEDTVVVELQTLDHSTYDYYKTLFPLTGGGLFGASNPSNPNTNLSNNALGYFGTYTICRDTIIVQPNLK